jgi:hypothetical protein
VADEYHRAILPVDDAFCRGNIIGEVGERLLDDAHSVSVFRQDVMNASPSRAIGRGTMHEYDVLHRANRRGPSLSGCTGRSHHSREGNA